MKCRKSARAGNRAKEKERTWNDGSGGAEGVQTPRAWSRAFRYDASLSPDSDASLFLERNACAVPKFAGGRGSTGQWRFSSSTLESPR
jgi:hypothetical protein